MTTQRIALVGAGLAGCECALQLARRGFAVTLFEQKPEAYSPAHSMPQLAELVCSNSLRSDELASGVGLIKQELRELGSALMAVPTLPASLRARRWPWIDELFAER